MVEQIAGWVLIFLFTVTFHEVAHGAVAFVRGDRLAKALGRLTLNPLKHIDWFWTVVFPLFLFFTTSGRFMVGMAKPVPVNPYNFRDQKYGSLKVALAGPASNFSIALVFGLILRFFPGLFAIEGLVLMFSYIVYINILLAIFNLMPVPPLDGSRILFSLLPYSARKIKIFFQQFSIFILLFIIFFFFPYLTLIINWIFNLITGFPSL